MSIRRDLLSSALDGPVYVPFCGDGDIAAELYRDRPIFGADIDAARIEAITARLQGTFAAADCDASWPFPGATEPFAVADFDAYAHPYAAFEQFWLHAPKRSDGLVVFFTDGHRQGIIRTSTLIDPEGKHTKIAALAERRRLFNMYWSKVIEPWFTRFLSAQDWKLVKEVHYIRGQMLYWGAVIARAAKEDRPSVVSQGGLDYTDEELGINPKKVGKFDPNKKRQYLQELVSGQSRSQAAAAVGVSLRTVEKHQAMFEGLREAISLAEMEANDAIENALYVAARSGNIIAMQVWLYNRMPQRWADRRGPRGLEGKDGAAPISISAGLGRGAVDPLTFATDEHFCGLKDLPERFPMQYRVLTEFMAPTSRYRVLVLVCGMRSGKGVIGSIVGWYAAYQLLSLANPQAYFGLTPDQEIQIVNMATSQAQARNNVFKHIEDRLNTGGQWFEDLRAQTRTAGLTIHLPKNIVIRCGHSKATTQVGATSYLVILDELARFKDTEGRDNAEYVYDLMSATTATFQQHGRVLVLSSPEWEGDKSMRLLEEALEENEEGQPVRPHMMGVQMASWEANKNLSFDYLWERFDGEGNPTAFWRDLGARPPTAVEGYYPDPERWDRQADPERHHPYNEADQLEPWFAPCCDSKRFVHVDLGATRDACGLAMAHKPVPGCPAYTTIEDQENPKAKKVVLDVVLQIVPPRRREQKGEISFEHVRQLIRDWHDRGFNIKGGQVSYDGWQSLDSQQILKREGFRLKEFSLDRDTTGHDTLQELLNTDALGYYEHPVLIREAKQLRLVRGKKVDHPRGGSKDVVDAAAGAAYWALKRGGRMKFVG